MRYPNNNSSPAISTRSCGKVDIRCDDNPVGTRMTKTFVCGKCERNWNGIHGIFLQGSIVWCRDCWNQLSENQRSWKLQKAEKQKNL